jgi:DNA-binding transcriptional LysR family regulator
MSIPSNQLDAFLAVARERSFTGAAAKLNVTQSALSQRIINLESDLGTALFVRDRKSIRLTDAAGKLFQYCLAKETLESQVLSELFPKSKGLSGVIRIGGFSSVMRSVILPALQPLLEKNPELQLVFLTRELRELPGLLRTGAVDFLVLNRAWGGEDMVRVELGRERNVLVRRKSGVDSDVFLDHDEQDQTTLQYLKMSRRKSTRLKRLYLDDVYGILDGVRMGLGKAVLPIHLIRQDKKLKVIEPGKVLDSLVILHHYHQPYYSTLHQEVLRTLKERCPQALAML